MTGTNLQGTNIISMIVPTNHADTYATHDSFYGKGGWREVDTLAARNEIPEERRRIGMVVYVRETFKAYLLKNSLSNAGWVPFNIDGEDYITETELQEALESYSTKAELQDVVAELQNWVEEYIDNIDLEDYQKKTDNSLQTTAKTIVGAINELNAKPHIDTYSKAEEDALLALKADKDELIDAYTKTETDAIVDELQTGIDKVAADLQRNYYNKDEIDEIISDIPVSDNVYTKEETNALLDEKVNTSDIFKNGVFQTENTKANGTYTRIWNEADGGGTQLIDGVSNVQSYTGVHEGSDGTNVYVQTYAVDKTTKVGTRINVNKEGAYYTSGKNTYTFTADDEIATKGDIPTVQEVADLVEQSDIFVSTDSYETKCAEYEAEIASLQEENAALQETVTTMQTKLDYVYDLVSTPHYDILPDEGGE